MAGENTQSVSSLQSLLSKRTFRTSSLNGSSTSIASLTNTGNTNYQHWLDTFYSSHLNEVIQFKDTSHAVTQSTSDQIDTSVDDFIEPCLLDCHTEDGYVMASIHMILHAIREKQASSPTAIATVGLSGGSSPREIFRLLGILEDLQIDFKRIIIFLVDERYVPIDDEMSNARLVKNTILKHWPIPPEHFIFPDTSLPLEDCVRKYEEDLEAVFGKVDVTSPMESCGKWANHHSCEKGADLVTLGIGDDFHIAGLFPEYLATLDASYVTDCFHRVIVTYTETAVVNERITLSLPFINRAKRKLFFLRGERKKRIWSTMVQYRLVDPIKFPATMLFTKPGCVAVLDSSTIRKVRKKLPLEPTDFLTCILFGACGDLSRRKLYPALFHLFYLGILPNNFRILAVSRTKLDFEEFCNNVSKDVFASINTNIFLRDPAVRFDFPTVITEFKKKLSCVTLDFENKESQEILNKTLADIEKGFAISHRLIYLATPAEAYHPIMRMATGVCRPTAGWFKVMLEKPFGRDIESALELENVLSQYLARDEMYLVDHYLGKPVISFIIAAKRSMRYHHLFHRKYIKSVHIKLKESIGSFGRRYFDSYGIIRDMIQNHGMQLLTLIAMDRPERQRKSLIEEKVRVLKHIKPVDMKDCVIGQYAESLDGTLCAYTSEPGINPDSLCTTYCTMVLYIDNETWRGVPFIITAGKGLDERLCEVRLNMLECNHSVDDSSVDTLVFRIQPNPSAFWDGGYNCERSLGDSFIACASSDHDTDTQTLKVEERMLRDIDYTLTRRPVIGCYEVLFYYAFGGKPDYFSSTEEARESWRILTPILNKIEASKLMPIKYPRGSAGPPEAEEMLKLL
ncbi:bifunctional Glucose-6-phosphate dehydrogenase/6-phosphogluconolactonase [Babesia duncani]|uniref:glucose-6-phosphate dehydrogenase (NADP(+)) n=1 Tax=Babesia duncani TaxID=323732 RepID=A0AAD9PJR7_9APIC|nr:bifunctional Glucose-6-phosphate dehydrogenase/6-phosphogluconolactonase [Babesia duncani]